MAHFARLDENNVVTQVIVVDNKDITDPHTGEEDEILGIAFCKKLLGGKWVQTSYNNNFRKRYAGIGYTYDKALDAFIASTQQCVTGEIRMTLHAGRAVVTGRQSEASLYDFDLATYDEGDTYDQSLAKGFVEIWGMPSRIAAARDQRLAGNGK